MAVIIGLVTPITFSTFQSFTKHLTTPRIGFVPDNLNFLGYIFVNGSLLICGILYWQFYPFIPRLYLIGIASSFFEVWGNYLLIEAYTRGPAGPTSAIIALSAIYTTIVIAIQNMEMLNAMEFAGLILGTYGGLVLVIPEFFEKFCFCCCVKKKSAETNQEALK